MSGDACAKIRYLSHLAARLAARQHHHAAGRLTAYRCDQCGFWHLTSQGAGRKSYYRRLARRG